MANTVIAIFNEIESARQAERYLVEKGYEQSEIVLKTAVYKDPSDTYAEIPQEPDLLEGFKAFFRNLFGNDEHQVATYHQVSHNRTIVTVHTTSDDDAEHVVSVLDSYGALDVHETAGSYHPDDENETRASAIKSRIVKRSLDNDNMIH
jgi:hypothetical protein